MNGFNSLVARIWGPFLLLSLAFMLLVGWYVPRQQQLALIEFQRQELTVMANTIARTMSIAAERDQLLDIPLYFKAIEEQESIQFSALQFEGDATLITSPPNINREQFEADDPLLVKVPFQGGRISGTIFVKGATTYSEAQLKELSLPLQVALSLVVLTVIGLYFFLLVRVSRPLQSLRATAETLRRGELDQPVDTRPRITEVRALNLALERLRSGLKEQRETNALLTQGMEREIRRQTKDLRKTLDELKDSRNLFGSVIESALDAVVLADGKSRIIEWNRKAEIIFGWTREEAVGKTLGELIIPHGFRESHDKGMDHYHATGHGPVLNKSFEIQALRKSGEVFDIELYITDVPVDNEIIFSSFIRDITEPKRLRLDLEQERTLSASLLNGLPLMVSLKNEDLQFTFVNDNACTVLGRTREELLGKEEKEVFSEEWVEDSIALDRAGYEGKDVPLREREFMVNGREEKYVIGRYQFSIGEDKPIRYLLTYGFNITQLKEIQAELETALQAKDEFLATVSHEIRTPLHSIIVLANLLNEEGRQEEATQFAQNIHTSSQHLLDLVNDILDFSKAEAGKLELAPSPMNLDDFLQNLDRVDSGQRKDAVQFNKTLSGCEGLEVECDATRLSQVLNNLLSNAFKFTEQGEVRLTVECERKGNEAHLHWSIRDTGIGISEENRDLIKEAFRQAHTGIARQFGGTGLGLGIVVRILNLMDSDLHIDSELGNGSEFSFSLTLPILQANTTIPVVEGTAEANPEGLRMLYVEDMLPNQMVMQAMCKPWNLDLTIADSGLSALELIGSQPFDLVLMDIQMPGMDGIETLQRMKTLDIHLPEVHAFTAHAGNDDRTKYRQLGFDGVLTKPITPSELEEFLKTHVHARHNRN